MSPVVVVGSALLAATALVWALALAVRHAWWMLAHAVSRPGDVARIARRAGVSRDAVRTRIAVAARRRRGR